VLLKFYGTVLSDDNVHSLVYKTVRFVIERIL